MKIELKNISINKRLSEETTCFVANIYVDGKKAGEASNRGNGGCTDVYFLDHNLQKQVEEFCKTLYKQEPCDSYLMGHIDNLVFDYMDKKECKNNKRIVIKLKSQPYGLTVYNTPYDPALKEQIRESFVKKYGDDLEDIINERL